MATSTTTVSGQQNIPEILNPYFIGEGKAGDPNYIPGLLPTAQSIFSQDYATYYKPLATSGLMGEGRIADIASTTSQQALRTGIQGLTTPSQFAQAAGYATSAATGLGALTGATAPTVSAMDLTQYQMAPTATVSAPTLSDYSMNAVNAAYTPSAQGAQMTAAQTGYQPNLTTFQMAEPEQFSLEAAQRYIDPYMQGVTDVAKRKAIEDARRNQLAGNLSAGRKGSLGSSGALLANTERERALNLQLGDIQTQGLASAYQNAQSQFERDRAAKMAAGQQNLAAQLGVQQLGTQTGLQTALANLNAQQQANVQNLAAELQTQGLNAQQALQVALANQQAGMTAGQQNLAAQLQTQQLGASQNLQAQQLNQAALQEAARQNLSAALGVQQLGAQQSLSAQQANQQAALQAQQQRLAAAQGLGNLAATTGQLGVAQQAAEIDRLKTIGAYGDLERAYAQQKLDAQYQDILRQIGYPEEQLGKMANILRGVPLGDTLQTGSQTTPPPSFASQLAGLGISGLSLYNLLNK